MEPCRHFRAGRLKSCYPTCGVSYEFGTRASPSSDAIHHSSQRRWMRGSSPRMTNRLFFRNAVARRVVLRCGAGGAAQKFARDRFERGACVGLGSLARLHPVFVVLLHELPGEYLVGHRCTFVTDPRTTRLTLYFNSEG